MSRFWKWLWLLRSLVSVHAFLPEKFPLNGEEGRGGGGGELQCILFNLWQECKTIDLATLISMVKQNPPLRNTMMRQFLKLLMQKASLFPPRSRVLYRCYLLKLIFVLALD